MAKYSPIAAGSLYQPEDRRKVKSAWDQNFEPYYGEQPQQGQHVEGQSFADLRDEMNSRRRQMARRVSGC